MAMTGKKYILDDICIDPRVLSEAGQEKALYDFLLSRYSLVPDSLQILKRSIDARKKKQVVWRFRIAVCLPDSAEIPSDCGFQEFIVPEPAPIPNLKSSRKVLVIGSGPAGLFCALRLIRSGCTVSILERGKSVEERDGDVSLLKAEGILNPESNILFGEGGAGTYSDGKLTTRTNRPEAEWFFHVMTQFGAQPEILYDAKPHVGTDVLSRVVTAVRKEIEAHGGKFHFGKRVVRLICESGSVVGVVCGDGDEYYADAVVLATGHSARDTYLRLYESGVALEKKGFAVGMRIEHPSEYINKVQYGSFAAVMPAADYRLAYNDHATGRGVYSFCMCPGGEVVNSSSEMGALCVNGMSMSARDSQWSNAAIVVTVRPEDMDGGVLSGIEFQRSVEQRCYQFGGGSFISPAQSVRSFLGEKTSYSGRSCSYRPGIAEGELSSLYPGWIADPLKRGLKQFDSQIRGFCAEGILIGAETRTSSPVRITRDETFQSVSHRRLFPIGEGAGYSGGIVSSAVDGIRCADAVAEVLNHPDFY